MYGSRLDIYSDYLCTVCCVVRQHVCDKCLTQFLSSHTFRMKVSIHITLEQELVNAHVFHPERFYLAR